MVAPKPPSTNSTHPPAVSSEIKFQEMLQHLIETSPFNRNRRPIWTSLGITSAALSQYLQGQSRPRLEALVGLADFFGVTLDYLVLGRESARQASEENRSVARYVDWALADIQAKVGQKSWLTSRVGQLLAERIDAAVQEVSASSMIGGALSNDELLTLESHSLDTRVLTLNLEADVIEVDKGNVAAARFGHVLADNLLGNPPRPYRFLYPEDRASALRPIIHAFRRLLRDELGVPEERLRLCEFRSTAYPVLGGCCMYKLDMDELRQKEPSLGLVLDNYTTSDGWLAFPMHGNNDTKAETLMNGQHVSRAVHAFDTMWRESEAYVGF